jgi:hypothetical protein
VLPNLPLPQNIFLSGFVTNNTRAAKDLLVSRLLASVDIPNLNNFPPTVSEVSNLYRETKTRGAVVSPVVFHVEASLAG